VTERTNYDRAMSAFRAVRTYAEDTRLDKDEVNKIREAVEFEDPAALGAEWVYELVSDLVSDLFHLGRGVGVEPDEIVHGAQIHFEAEVAEEDGDD